MHSVLKFSDIDLCYKDSDRSLVVLNKANFSLGVGEAVAIIAPSGAGKSTLLHIAGLLERPEAGEVWICGKACSRLGEDARTEVRRSEIGFIYQFHHLLPEFTALENVMIPQMIAGLDRKTAMERSLRLLEYLRIDHRSRHRPSELSGGEQQRVAIARSVANAPLILLADEPTGNLDPATSNYVFRALFALVRESGLSTLVATHNYSLAEKMDRRLTLSKGRVIELD